MKTTNKFIAVSAMVMATGILLAGCQREESGNLEDGKLVIGLQMEDLSTKVDVDGNTGACTWSSGDQIGIFVVNESEGNAYHPVTVNTTSNTVHLAMTPEMSLSGYALTPYAMCDASDPAPTGATPRVHYLTTYSMEGLDLTSDSFSNIPMMAVNNASLLSFYHVGGLLRLILSHVPENTDKIAVEFVGMTHVCGKCTVTKPGTRSATTAITIGEGNTVTFTDVTRSASTMYLNVPLPSIDFSALTAIRIRAYQGSTLLAVISKSTGGSWGVFKHGYGRMQDVDFAADALSGVRLSSNADITLWKSKTVTRTATALDQYGLPYADVTVTWESSDTDVATVNANTGVVTAKRALNDGYTTITATATPNTGGTPYSASYRVYVNEVTGITLSSAKTSVKPSATTIVTATIAHTNNGTILSYPSEMTISWTSGSTGYVTVSPASSLAEKLDDTHAIAITSATGVAATGASTIRGSVPGAFTETSSIMSNTASLVCTYPGSMGGYYLSRGILEATSATDLTLTDGTDQLLQMRYYQNIGNLGEDNPPVSGVVTNTRHYFNFNELWNYFNSGALSATTRSSEMPTTGSIHKIQWGGYEWYAPTNSVWSRILGLSPSRPGSTVNGTSGRRYALIRVKLNGDSEYDNKGLSSNSTDPSTSLNSDYIAGLLLFPDGGSFNCATITTFDSRNMDVVNSCTAAEFRTLCEGEEGCVFIPFSGYCSGSTWGNGGSGTFHGSATNNGYLLLRAGYVDETTNSDTNKYFRTWNLVRSVN